LVADHHRSARGYGQFTAMINLKRSKVKKKKKKKKKKKIKKSHVIKAKNKNKTKHLTTSFVHQLTWPDTFIYIYIYKIKKKLKKKKKIEMSFSEIHPPQIILPKFFPQKIGRGM